MNKKNHALNELLSNIGSVSLVDEQDRPWWNARSLGKEIVVDEYTSREDLLQLAQCWCDSAETKEIAESTLLRRLVVNLNDESTLRVYRIVTVIDSAVDAFSGDLKAAFSWCFSSSSELKHISPIDFVDKTTDVALVLNVLGLKRA